MIDIVASYHCMQFQRKVMTRTPENGKKKRHFGPDLGLLGPNSGHTHKKNFFEKT